MGGLGGGLLDRQNSLSMILNLFVTCRWSLSFSNFNKNRKNILSTMTKRNQFVTYLHYVKDFYLDHLSPQMISIEEIS